MPENVSGKTSSSAVDALVPEIWPKVLELFATFDVRLSMPQAAADIKVMICTTAVFATAVVMVPEEMFIAISMTNKSSLPCSML